MAVARQESVQPHDKNQDLIRAVSKGDLGEVTRLLESGADVNGRDRFRWPALVRAAERGDLGLVKVLLDKGADVNTKDENDRTALKIAQEKGFEEVVALLRARDAKE